MSALKRRNSREAELLRRSKKPEGYLTTYEFARAVGEPAAVILEKHRIGMFKAAIHYPTGGRGKTTYYAREQIEQYNAMKDLTVDPVSALRVYAAEEAKAGFAAIQAGKTMRDLVIELGIHPARARAISDDYAAMGGGVYLAPDDLNAILALDMSGPTEIRSVKDILEILETASSNLTCSCGEGERALCITCVNDRVRKAAGAARQKQASPQAPENGDPDDEEAPRRAG